MITTREIIARPKEGGDIRDEFVRFLEEADKKQWGPLRVMFGFAWANYVYEGDWIEEELTTDEIRLRVKEAEAREDGRISGDDLFIKVKETGLEHTFCHENDIHLKGAPDNEHLSAEAARFRALGWDVRERTNSNKSTD